MNQPLSKANKSWINNFIGGLPLYENELGNQSSTIEDDLVGAASSHEAKTLDEVSNNDVSEEVQEASGSNDEAQITAGVYKPEKPDRITHVSSRDPQCVEIDIRSISTLIKRLDIQSIQVIGVPGGSVIRPGVKVAPLTWEIEQKDTSFIDLRVGPNNYREQFSGQNIEFDLLFKISGQELGEQGLPTVYKSHLRVPRHSHDNPPALGFVNPIVLEIPKLDTDIKPEPEFVTLAKQGNDKIIVRLGVAPALGDPKYHILIDGYHIAEGKVDWSVGVTNIEPDKNPIIVWQDIEIPWNFDILMPSILAVGYENETGEQKHNIAIGHLEIKGVQIDVDNHSTSFPGGRKPFAGRLDFENLSWGGDVIFNVSRALWEAEEPIATETPVGENVVESVLMLSAHEMASVETTGDELFANDEETPELPVSEPVDHNSIPKALVPEIPIPEFVEADLQAISLEEAEAIRNHFSQHLLNQAIMSQDRFSQYNVMFVESNRVMRSDLKPLLSGGNIRNGFYTNVMMRAKSHLER